MRTWFAGILGTIITGVAVWWLTQGGGLTTLFGPNRQVSPPVNPFVLVQYAQRGLPFLVIRSDSGGKDISAPKGYWWHEMAISISSQCNVRVFLDPVQFVLYVTPNQNLSGHRGILPQQEAASFQRHRLAAKWLSAGETVEGRLIYPVQGNIDAITKRNKVIRFRGLAPCPIRYDPW
jgi:hypothetical protein